MIDRIIEFSVRNKLIIGLFVLILIAAGVYSASKLPVDAVPDITNNQVLIITVSPSLAAPEVERLITAPTERLMASLPQLKEMRSISRFGLSNVTVVFDDGVDITKARQQVSERLNQLKGMIPPGIGEPDMGPVTTGLGEVYQYYVVPKPGYENRYTLTQLRTLQEWIVRRQLLGVPGVADVSSLGGKLKQYQVVVDPAKIKSLGITLDQLFNAVQQNNENTGGAYIENGPNAYYIRTEGMASSIEDLQSIPVKTSRGIPMRLADVAEIKEGSAIRFGAMYNNKYGEVSGAVVLMLKGANAMDVVKNVKEKVELIKKRLPEGVTILPYYERSKMVGNSISTVKRNLIEGALIVIFVLVVFLGNFRSGLVVASVIPLAMLFALIVMNIFHVSANLMSLGALDFGLIVDGAVIIVEGVMHRFRDKINNHLNENEFSQNEVDDEVKQSASRLMSVAIFGQIIILIVYLPILSLEGIEGKMFRPMAETVAFALLGAFILSLTYVPMMTALTMSKKTKKKTNLSDKMMAAIQRRYEPLLKAAIAHTKMVILIAVLLFGLAYWVFNGLGGEFIPQLEEGDFALDARFLPGTSLTQTIKGMKMASEELKKFPEVQQVTCRIGSAEIPTDPMSLEQCDVFITLNDKSTWTTAKDYAGLQEAMSKKLSQIPGLNVGFEYPVQMRFNELISGAKQDVVVKIFGDDLTQLAKLAGKLSGLVAGTKGAADVYSEKIGGLPQIVVHYNRAALAQYNVSISQVNHTVNATFAGEKAGNMYEGERQFDIMLRIADTARANFDHIGELLVNTSNGNQVPLSQLASIEIKDGPNQVQRENGERKISVSFNVRGRDVEGVVKDLQAQVQQQLKLPPGYHVEYGGQFENLNSAKARLAIAVPGSLFFIFILLYFTFNQFREALIVFSAIPLAATGGVFALWIRGMAFSISAGVGFIALFGVAVLNGIVLISEFNRLKEDGDDDADERIKKGTANRLRPVLMTATVASLGFFPMAISTHAGAEVQRPLATVVIGGLITATLLTLVVLPALYKQFASKPKADGGGKGKAKKSTIITVLLLCFVLPLKAQINIEKRITVNEAITLALNNNLTLKAAQNQTLAGKANVGSAYDIAKTQLSYDAGNINSSNTDNRFSVTQNFALPGYYTNQRNYYNAEAGLSALQEKNLRNQLAYQVRDVYLQLTASIAKLQLLKDQDSVYTNVIKLEQLRFKMGETSRINLTSAEAKAGMLINQRQLVESEIGVLQNKLMLLTGGSVAYLPTEQAPPAWQNIFLPDTAKALDNPEVKQAQQQVLIAGWKVKVSKAKALPDLSLSYSNQSLAGPDIRNSNLMLNKGARFSSYMVGLNIPLFFNQYKAAVKSAGYQKKASEYTYTAKQLEWRGQWLQSYRRYSQQLKALNYYESAALKQASELVRTATLSFNSGGISYLEWANYYNQSIQLRTDRLDALLQLDQTINQLWYYQGETEKP
ncbi:MULTISPECIES: CusA/CzcA family heavy metal efflux RND transporter [unclassified Mucilaginibacter]|uniref:CusA/CzcA family heavy metal efflux RND transporter n=1 Tax=unclassified Mucilaginibacter TaxID=2617802 RepID=UPI002B23A390|nr:MULTISPECIES: CusA/CzcA family heavy metal efflux RND transporter [unclassified Mucilaginibacter]MEB0261911.1 CusA/CzcA family heavy metal efflux RND transporter [Mucilaginibacter sp. 10I4]MEB0277640.1 CusA/CzcA family heavy metal efflux RND transporter [Mucilaginibacter sp. 10B2]MEB0299555.1 CusA/CzcA family heavy metal efflux RND transporter [Mucilaginibacter sp. 5C4]